MSQSPYLLRNSQRTLKVLLMTASAQELAIDWARRIKKPKFLLPTVPRDVLTCVQFFHIKELALHIHRHATSLPEEFANVSLYTDISATTL